MKKLGKTFIALTVMLSSLASCSNDEPIYMPPAGSVEEEDGQYVSVFTLNSPLAFELKESEKVTFHITSPQMEEDFTFEGTVRQDKSVTINGNKICLLCRLILSNINIPDGDYYLNITGENIPDLGTYKVSISNSALTQLLQSSPSYKGLSGEGTKDNPYQLKSSADLERMMSCLRDDPDHGMGLYFSMTQDISLRDEQSGILGTASFQGTLDGHNHKLTGMPLDEETDKSLYKKFSFTDISSSTGFVMTNYGPVPSGIPMDVKCGNINPWPSDLIVLN
ncbi:MAG: hypothetical protein K2J48_06960 [Muribaculaceae bacterium]|nr:hypothetical protein [Muribaculaceae bacterium]